MWTRPIVAAPGEDGEIPGTEVADPALRDLDLLAVEAMVALALEREQAVLAAVRAAAPQIGRMIELATAALERGGRVVYAGAGTAGRVAAMDATEIPPTFGTDPGAFTALVAGGPAALVDAREGDEDDAGAGAAAVAEAGVRDVDLVIGVSASGATPYVLAAIAAARERGCTTVAVVNNAGTPLAAAADLAVEVLTGPELVAGSTRLMAGTAQKTVLNLVSTLAMVRTGHTFGNLMVGAAPVNAKLARRAVRSVALAAEVDDTTAQAALDAADGAPDTAVVMLRAALGPDQARARLRATDGRVRDACRGAG